MKPTYNLTVHAVAPMIGGTQYGQLLAKSSTDRLALEAMIESDDPRIARLRLLLRNLYPGATVVAMINQHKE